MYKPETMQKFKRLAIAAFHAADDSRVRIVPKGNDKIGECYSVGTLPIVTCTGCCGQCCKYCYDIGDSLRYPEVMENRATNTAVLNRSRDDFFRQITEKCKRARKIRWMRWHTGGEIVDYDYLCRMMEVARAVKNFTFWAYTKRYALANRYISEHGPLPENFKMMFSEWDGLPMDNPYGLPVFKCRLKGTPEPDIEWKCPGKCDVCKRLGRGCVAGESAWIDEH